MPAPRQLYDRRLIEQVQRCDLRGRGNGQLPAPDIMHWRTWTP
jgi:hypothetical protein